MAGRKRSSSGFTLIELMIVVVIIGILATMALPRFMKAGVKTKQSEAKVNLAGIFGSETTYFVEKGWYGSTLPAIGFSLAGKAVYYDFTLETPSGTPPTMTWTPNAWWGAHGTPGDGPPAGMIVNLSQPGSLPGVSQLAFTALAAGNADPDPTYDTWTINSGMVLKNQWNDIEN